MLLPCNTLEQMDLDLWDFLGRVKLVQVFIAKFHRTDLVIFTVILERRNPTLIAE